jgi:hypothetical protein
MKPATRDPDCPYCGAAMHTAVMACDRCVVEVRGRFRTTHFSRLPDEDLEFLERYLLAGFSIKALAEISGMGYVAIRTRLDRVIRLYRDLHDNEEAQHVILERLDKGEISPAEAEEAMEKL